MSTRLHPYIYFDISVAMGQEIMENKRTIKYQNNGGGSHLPECILMTFLQILSSLSLTKFIFFIKTLNTYEKE